MTLEEAFTTRDELNFYLFIPKSKEGYCYNVFLKQKRKE